MERKLPTNGESMPEANRLIPEPAPKPENSTWTDDQWAAIACRGQNLLVAAAAGSGKTAVLVERIIRRITDSREPIDVDRLLVATFTKAAAAEMRERIRHALEDELVRRPDSDHLRRQLALLGRASITTLHSFCMEVVRRYFHLVSLDPGFRIANEMEAELLKQDALEEVLEERYADSQEDSAFWRLLDSFGGTRGDDGPLLSVIRKLYEDSRSHPAPDDWLRQQAESFESAVRRDASAVVEEAFDGLLSDVRMELRSAARLLQRAIAMAMRPGGPDHYIPAFEEDLALLDRLAAASADGWELAHEAFRSVDFVKLKSRKSEDADKELQERVKKLRDTVKERVGKLQNDLFHRSEDEFRGELANLAPAMRELVDIVIAFSCRYQAAKADKQLVDFTDLEHFALQVLRDPDSSPEDPRPSEAALQFREQFVEILLDEYQDTNRVQETIVSLLARDGNGNRFMVGDVKQSIYRFRLADPGLFLEKYRSYIKEPGRGPGRRIDLARNFRSRRQVVEGANDLFRMMMDEAVGEVDYDEAAELVYGAGYPEDPASDPERYAVELLIVDKTPELQSDGTDDAPQENAEAASSEAEADAVGAPAGVGDELAELETAQLEARLIGLKLRELLGMNGGKPFMVHDKKLGMRPACFRDAVILLRATRQWAPVLIEELKAFGIPAYADLDTGYFSATEVETLMSLLRVVDNPYQDIPLAGVLRSPIVGLKSDELAQIRLARRDGSYFDAVLAAAGRSTTSRSPAEPPQTVPPALANTDLKANLNGFLDQLEAWREDARQGTLSDLIWRIYRETGYYDFVGGMPGGVQRQANLRALHDRARQYEATTFRGLFRFLRFIDRMRESGADLGTARAIGEQEDVVRIMTIHKSKGLEFPLVFIAGMGKMFNLQDLNAGFLLHKELGFGPKVVDAELRVSYPSLPYLAIRRRLKKETLAEEMRILYVALTRAREKLYLLGTVKGLAKKLEDWAQQLDEAVSPRGSDSYEAARFRLPEDERARAGCYLDWVVPAVMRHPDGEVLRTAAGCAFVPDTREGVKSSFRAELCRPAELAVSTEPQSGPGEDRSALIGRLRRLEPIGPEAGAPSAAMQAAAAGLILPERLSLQEDAERTALRERLSKALSWSYPHAGSARLLSKTSVTELKRLGEAAVLAADESHPGPFESPVRAADGKKPAMRRPAFMCEAKMTAAERGTVYHAVMQHVPLKPDLGKADIVQVLERMAERKLLSQAQKQAVDVEVIGRFFEGRLGKVLLASPRVLREVPFSYGLRAGDLYPGAEAEDETVLVQGVIDCLFETREGLVLLDYKTDSTTGVRPEQLAERYRVQIGLYAEAIGKIWGRPPVKGVLFFFDGAMEVEMAV